MAAAALKGFKKVQAFMKELNSLFPEREKEIQGAICSILTGQHMVMIGPPSTGKTVLTKTISRSFGLSFFTKLMTQQTTEDAIFGGPDIARLTSGDGAFVRRTQGYAADSQVVYLDEIFKCNSGTLNALLALMEERIYENPVAAKVPLVSLFGSSNEMPDDESLGALWSRFGLRFWVNHLTKEKSRLSLTKQ